MRFPLLRNTALGILVAAAFLASCETAVNPLIGEPRPFTIWGLLDTEADTQRVRIFSIEGEPGVDRPGSLDAAVTTTDLETGETLSWTPYRVTYGDSITAHLFQAVFRPVHGHRYRLDVTRSDGAVSTATVEVPPEVDFTIERSDISPRIHVYVRGDPLPNLLGVEMRYEATNVPPAQVWPTDLKLHPLVAYPVEVSYQGTEERVADGIRYDINMATDFDIVEETYKSKCLVTEGNPNIALRRVEFHFVAANEEWSRAGRRIRSRGARRTRSPFQYRKRVRLFRRGRGGRRTLDPCEKPAGFPWIQLGAGVLPGAECRQSVMHLSARSVPRRCQRGCLESLFLKLRGSTMMGRFPHLLDPAAAHHIVALVQHHGLPACDGLTRHGENYAEFIRPFLPHHAGHARIVVADFHVHR